MFKASLWLTPLALLFFTGCHKYVSETKNVEEIGQAANSTNLASARLSYGDTIFYLKNQPGNYTILPVSKPSIAGYFKANPLGLVLDSVTGRINVTKSETGLRYKVYYLSRSGERVDSVKLVVSGIDYADRIYELRATPVTYDTAFPIYNARPNLILPCSSDDDDDGEGDDDQDCIFDETDLNNDGNDDIPGVIQSKLLVDTKQGMIDLEASFHAGVFGSSNPGNGVRKDFTYYYRLNDKSNRALNKIAVRLYHFKKRSDIPQWLHNELNNRKNLSTEVNSWANRSNYSTFRQASQRGVESKPKRPPFIIIVSQ